VGETRFHAIAENMQRQHDKYGGEWPFISMTSLTPFSREESAFTMAAACWIATGMLGSSRCGEDL
jgi:hypothetical protein